MSRLVLSGVIVFVALSSAAADEPLHQRIDRLIAERAGDVELAGPAGDAEFHRRIWLDLAGRIPTADETRAFLTDETVDKRQRLIEARLDSPEYARRMTELFHAMLMERRSDNDDWLRFLRTAFAHNLPWDQMAHALIRADAGDASLRGAAFFLTARLVSEGAMAPVDVPGLTRDVGRLLAGVDLGCAQCHNHLSIGDYRQKDFQGLHMIFENMQTRRDVKFPAVSEKLMTQKKEFQSVFDQTPVQTGPVVPGGKEITVATFEKGEEYAVAPDPKTRAPGVPKFSPLHELATGLAATDNRLFRRNIANRLWFVMMGRGLVEPLDVHHSENPPTHPELLDLLATEFAAHDFNIRWFLRELALTDTYQRTSRLALDAETPPAETYAVALEKRLNAEQYFWSILTATGELDHQTTAQVETTAIAESSTQAPRESDQPPAEPQPVPLDLTDIEEVQAGSEELIELRKLFIDTFANQPKEPEVDFTPTVKAALFLMHDEKMLALLKPRDGNLIQRLADREVPELTDELFLTVLSRHPTDADRNTVTTFLAKHPERRTERIGQLVWAMLSSTEFCVNH